MPKILISEDEPDIRDLVSITLQFAGFEVISTTNGAELLDRVRDVMPDLILTDVRMPKMTGYEACRALKQMPEVAHIPVVFLSAKGQEEEVKQGMEAGALAYILKPFAPDQLVTRIKDLLSEPRHPQPPPAVPEAPEAPPAPPPAPAAPPAPPAAPAASGGMLSTGNRDTKPLGPLPEPQPPDKAGGPPAR